MLYLLNMLNLLILTVSPCMSWMYFNRLQDLTLSQAESDAYVHSEYRFGDCKDKSNKLVAHVGLSAFDVLGKIIIKGWLDIHKIPNCVILRGTSDGAGTVAATSYPFQICVPMIAYTHSRRRFKYFFYEWMLPYDYEGGMDWDLYFYNKMSHEI